MAETPILEQSPTSMNREGLQIEKDDQNRVRLINHKQTPLSLEGVTPQQLTQNYVEKVADIYGVDSAQLTELSLAPKQVSAAADAHFRTRAELKPGVRIINARGAPGTLGCLAFTLHDQRVVMLTTHHLLFDREGHEDEPVWLAAEASREKPYLRIGQSLYGRSRIVHLDGDEHYVDCAVASVTTALSWRTRNVEDIRVRGGASPVNAEHDIARPGDRVTKTGATTGTTVGNQRCQNEYS